MKKLLILALGLVTIATASAFTVVFSGGDLVTNGEFYTDTDWNKEAGWTISGGKANCDGTNSARIYQVGFMEIGKKYRITLDITDYTSGGLEVYTSSYESIGTSEGTVSFDFNATIIDLYLRSNSFIGSIDNVSVKEVKESTKINQIVTNGGMETGGTVDSTLPTGWTDYNTPTTTYKANTASVGGTGKVFAGSFSSYLIGPNDSGILSVAHSYVAGRKYRITARVYTITDEIRMQRTNPGIIDYSVASTTTGAWEILTYEGTALTSGSMNVRFNCIGTAASAFIDEVSVIEVTRSPYSKGKIGEWTLAEDDQQSDTRSLDFSGAGTSSVASTQAYGKWEFDLYKGGDGNLEYFHLINSNTLHDSGNDGYGLTIGSLEPLLFFKSTNGSRSNLFNTADSYIDNNTWYRLKVERTGDGEFTVYIKGGSFGDDYVLVDVTGGSGTNPVTDNTYTTSAYMVADLDAGDKLRGVWSTDTGGIPVSDFTDGTGTTSVAGNIVVSDRNPNRNHGTVTDGAFSYGRTSKKLGDNLVTNGSMEGSFTSGVADDWTEYEVGQTYAEETSNVRIGTKAQKVTCADDSKSIGIYQTPISLEVGKKYKVSVSMYRSNSLDATLYYNGTAETSYAVTADQNSWTDVQTEVTATGASMQLWIYQANHQSGIGDSIIIDNVSVEEIETGQSMLFDGADTKVDTGSDMIDVGAGTITAWVNASSFGESSRGTIATNGKSSFWISDKDGNNRYVFSGVDLLHRTNSETDSAVLNEWQFVAVTKNSAGSATNFYVGDLDTTPALSGSANQNSGTPESGTTNVILGNNDAQSRTFDGLIQDVRIFDRVLSLEEIIMQYNQ